MFKHHGMLNHVHGLFNPCFRNTQLKQNSQDPFFVRPEMMDLREYNFGAM